MTTDTTTTPTAMRALVGGKADSWVLETDAPLPDQLGALRIQVHAAGLNRADLYALDGSYTANSQGEGPFTAGMEIAGIVERGSLLAPDLPTGTRVMGITTGGFADYALGHPRLMVPIPDSLSFEEAATLPVGLITEHDALVTQAGFGAGDSAAPTTWSPRCSRPPTATAPTSPSTTSAASSSVRCHRRPPSAVRS